MSSILDDVSKFVKFFVLGGGLARLYFMTPTCPSDHKVRASPAANVLWRDGSKHLGNQKLCNEAIVSC